MNSLQSHSELFVTGRDAAILALGFCLASRGINAESQAATGHLTAIRGGNSPSRFPSAFRKIFMRFGSAFKGFVKSQSKHYRDDDKRRQRNCT